jgi:hypothetical protein
MPRKWIYLGLSLLALAALLGVTVTWHAQAATPTPQSPSPSSASRTTQADGAARQRAVTDTVSSNAPAIGFIDSPTPLCYNNEPGTGVCYVTWEYMAVSASPSQYMVSMTLSIDNAIRAYHAGFFQTSLNLSGDAYGKGFRVTCGWPGAGGTPGMGLVHNYSIRAYETGGLSSSNFGSVLCPADVVKRYVPIVRK